MAAKTQPDLIDIPLTRDVKNAVRMLGINLADVSADRPVLPDGLKIMAELWNSGASVPDIMGELRLSEARVSAELLFLEIKGQIHGFVDQFFYGLRRKGNKRA